MKYTFTGHETFAFRYAWLPKAYEAVKSNPSIFSDEDSAMIELGVGKNMVRAIRFWGQVAGVLNQTEPKKYTITPFGQAIFCRKEGLDPFLEDIQTLWLLHWKIATGSEPPYAWYFLLNRWQESELVPSVILTAIQRECEGEFKISKNSLSGLLSVFFHTYVPTRGKKSTLLEDNLDCPLIQLKLIQRVAERESSAGKKETIYTLRRGEKPEISLQLFYYCLIEFWEQHAQAEMTLSFREIAWEEGSPGQVFKLNEEDIRRRLEQIPNQYKKFLSYSESSLNQMIQREFDWSNKVKHSLLSKVYQ